MANVDTVADGILPWYSCLFVQLKKNYNRAKQTFRTLEQDMVLTIEELFL